MKRVAIVVLALGAALASGCGTSSEVRRWFAADRTMLTSKTVPAEPIYVDVLGGGDLQQEIANEVTRRFQSSKYLKRALSADAPLMLEVEPLDVYYGEDDPTFGPTIVWTTVVFRASLLQVGSDKPLLEGVIASYKGYEPQDWDKLSRTGLRRAAVRDGVQKLVGLIETNTPKAGDEKKTAGIGSMLTPAPAPAPVEPAAPRPAASPLDPASEPQPKPAPSSGKNPSPH